MFTGIIEEAGKIKGIQMENSSAVLSIGCKTVLEDADIGDSIAVNGICLTVTSFLEDGFTADVMPETLKRTSLSEVSEGSIVNLERAMAADGRFGGHIVAGHIDGVGAVSKVSEDGNAIWYTIQAEKEILRYIVEKGSITIDGISLTVAETGRDYFKVSVIPHTMGMTNLPYKEAGNKINLEVDIVGKYIEKFVTEKREEPELTEDFLRENGF